jgi:hypothetical protein
LSTLSLNWVVRYLAHNTGFQERSRHIQIWGRWVYFWHSFTTTGGKLETPLGGWTNLTHRIWTWYYHKGRDELYKINGMSITYYKQDSGWQRTRATLIFLKARKVCNVLELPSRIPTSVIEISASTVTKLQEGPRSPKLTKTSQMFWEFISTWRGTWMWEGINASMHSKDNLTWIAEGMTNETLFWTTYGSYDRKKAANLSGVGWIIFCSQTGMRISGNFWEQLLTAS